MIWKSLQFDTNLSHLTIIHCWNESQKKYCSHRAIKFCGNKIKYYDYLIEVHLIEEIFE